jgi:lipoate-protein ligase B
MENHKIPTWVVPADHMAYTAALRLMRNLVEIKRKSYFPEILLLLEHEPVLTMGRRSQDEEIVVSQSFLSEKGISVHRVERGGLVTYHGPGQLVGYTLFQLAKLRITPGELVQGLEEAIINTLDYFGIAGNRKEGYRGVWVGDEKIASLGIAVRGGISFHGFALNYDPDLSHFDLIHPCGLHGVHMTSMAQFLDSNILPAELRGVVSKFLCHEFDLECKEYSLAMLSERMEKEKN